MAKEVRKYCCFRATIELGINVGINDLPFEKAMIFSWIKEEIESERKTRI